MRFRTGFHWISLLLGMATASGMPPGLPSCQAQEGWNVQKDHRIVVRPPRFRRDHTGFIVTKPNVEVFGEPTHSLPARPITPQRRAVHNDPSESIFGEVVGALPEPQVVVTDEYGHHCESCDREDCDGCDECSPWHQLFAFKLFKTSCDIGIGHERVMFAPFELENAQPLNNVAVRWDTYNRMITPDRAEYFWARPGVGPPLPEENVDYQELRFRLETGGELFSMITEIPLRSVDPVVNDNTTGLSNIRLAPKAVLINGRRWKVSTIFSTFLKTGSPARGWAVDQISLEPGLLVRYEWTKRTFLHSQVLFRFPVGGDPDFAGQVLKYGFGVSTILYETDTFAALPVVEFVGWSVLDGQKSLPDGSIVGVDGENFGAVFPGIRFVLGPANELGLFELGIAGGVSFANNGFFENMLRVDLRFSY